MAKITYTLVGSDGDKSRVLCSEIFSEHRYFEYTQPVWKTMYESYDVLHKKFRYTFSKSMEIHPDVSLLMGSNDYVSYNFFEQLIEFYKEDENQIYGIDKYTNGENCMLLYIENNINNTWFWWSGEQPCRTQYHYTGGILGFNRHLWEEYSIDRILSIINCDEGMIEENILNLGNVKKFNSKIN